MNLASGPAGFSFEAHDEVHHEAGVSSTIEQVARGYQVCLATAPGEIIINDARYLESLDQRIVSAVHIANGNNSIRGGEMPLVSEREGAGRNQEKQKRDQPNKWAGSPVTSTRLTRGLIGQTAFPGRGSRSDRCRRRTCCHSFRFHLRKHRLCAVRKYPC